jgi:pimeloyl-ACP methyl ester carboxylesterase
VLEAGATGAPAVVLLHGWGVSAYLWRHTIPALAGAGWRVFAPDLPGHGLSDAPTASGSYALRAFADRVDSLLEALGASGAPLVAQSMGGRIAIEVARRGRTPALALFGPVGLGDVNPAHVFAPFIPTIPGEFPSLLVTRGMVEMVQRRVHGKLGWFTERDVDEYWAPTQFPQIVRAQLQMLREFTWSTLERQDLAAVTMPTLVVFGTRDRTVRPERAERLAAALRRGRFEWIEGGGHVVMEEAPERVHALLVEFLRAVA